MGYDRGDRFPFEFEPNEIPSGSKSKGKLSPKTVSEPSIEIEFEPKEIPFGSKGKQSPRSYPIQFERKWKPSVLGVQSTAIDARIDGQLYTLAVHVKVSVHVAALGQLHATATTRNRSCS